jgi:hypothetical protein
LIGFGLLRSQLKDSGTRQQQKREDQPICFHIARLAGSPWKKRGQRSGLANVVADRSDSQLVKGNSILRPDPVQLKNGRL